MNHTLLYIAVKSSLHSSTSTVFGLADEEVAALSAKFGGTNGTVINGVLIKAAPIQLINCLGELGYKIVCCSGEAELTWTMMSHCTHNSQVSSVFQTLDELAFEKGIWFAAQNNDIPKVIEILGKGKDVNAEDKSGYTALHYASRNGHVNMCKLLISKGANINALTRLGHVSSLHRCAAAGHLKIFKLLYSAGAAIDLKDGDGKTVLHRAVENGHYELTKEILSISPHLKEETDNRGKLPKDYIKHSVDLFNDLFN